MTRFRMEFKRVCGACLVAVFCVLLGQQNPAQAALISFDASSLMQSTVTTGNGDLIGPAGFPAGSLPAASTYTLIPTFKTTNIGGVSTLAPYVDMVKLPVFAFYRTVFDLPIGFSGLSFSFQALFDNELQLYLNGTSIVLDDTGLGFGCTGITPSCMNFSAPRLPVSAFSMSSTGAITNPIPSDQSFAYVTLTQSLFAAGVNELIFALGNSGGGTGDLGFRLDVNFPAPVATPAVPEPSSILLLASSLGLLGWWRRGRRQPN